MTVEQLRKFFSGHEWPTFERLSLTDGDFTVDLFLEPEVRWFGGHFPDQPVLAGVVQTHWAGEIGRALFGIVGECIRIENLKFQSMLLPDRRVALQLTYVADKNWLKFRFEGEAQCFSQGKLVFEGGQVT